jgi:hypothetical protein
MRRLAALALIVASAGCSVGEDDGRSVEPRALRNLVLQPADLPGAFIRFDEGPQSRADLPGGRRSEATRFGRVEGWKARYRRPGPPTTTGPLVIESRVDLFDSADGAEEELDAVRLDGLEGDVPWSEIEAPELGDEAIGLTFAQGEGPASVRFYLLAWRQDNVAASVHVNGFDRRMSARDAVQLARKQASRIADAASG